MHRQHHGSFVTSDDTTISYVIAGQGEPVVLVAGLGDDTSSWAPQIEELALTHLVIALDNRGMGNSSIPEGPYTTERMAEDANELIESLSVGPVAVVGCSMGGAICQHWALSHPSAISRIFFTNTWSEQTVYTNSVFSHLSALSLAPDASLLSQSVAQFCMSPAFFNANPGWIDEFLAAPPPDLDGFRSQVSACLGHTTLDRLHEIEQPTLILGATRDICTPFELSENMASRIPNSELRAVATGHAIPWEQPALFMGHLRDFLS